jgi:hypothetical protein
MGKSVNDQHFILGVIGIRGEHFKKMPNTPADNQLTAL